ncbi:DNA polymerase Y family protein [Variovorax sp. J2P1-59]|uniref:Y-family DNA polymerase n=1 Tax=Variovorax flavidus TaxID=3053501 RepID=UPI0025764D47|nr:DNA polymerase Y family protein [Variovorax sp. J2P1-59]MDM0072761.1 DNA polymerase Y family protein [Variovorax sp. J2P1-59]
MHWIALHWLQPEAETPMPPMPSDEALGWWALQFTPRVAWVDEALLLEVSACERLWGGRLALMRQIVSLNPAPVRVQQAQGATCLSALARLRMFARGEKPPADVPSGLPLDTLSAARDHLDVLAHLGCRTWGDVAALPRGGLTRRFGKELRSALDAAYGLRPESHCWLTLPDVFEQKLELPALAEGAPELMWSANRLLSALQIWLRARQRGARALELQWTLDLKRLNGVNLPPHQHITVRTAEATQDMAHLRRLISEKLALTTLAAPASWLRLRSLETDPWAGASTSFLPEDNRKGDRFHEMVERLSARLGPQQVLVPTPQADHRPERKQTWQPALQAGKGQRSAARSGNTVESASPGHRCCPLQGGGRLHEVSQPGGDAIYPAWLLPEPLRLDMEGERPCYRGPLRRLIGPQRVEAGWWGGVEDGGRPAVRDYYVAESPEAGLVWIFRERPAACFVEGEVRWYLQGLYA